MPAVQSYNGKVTAYRRGTRSADWSTFVADCADLTKKYVRAPAGTHDVGAGLVIKGQDRLIEFDGCILTVNTPTTLLALTLSSTSPNIEKQASATITTETRTLTVLDGDFAATVSPGDAHFVRIGVQSFDPQEPYYSVLRFVESVNGSEITYTEAFGIEPPVYASEAALEAVTGYPNRVGPWGTLQDGFFARGLGTDHGVRAISYLSQNVTLRNVTIKYAGTETMYGAWGITIGLTLGCRVEEPLIVNPHGSAIHCLYSTDAVIDRPVVTGTGRAAPFGGTTKTNWAVLWTAWASTDCTLMNGIMDTTDCEGMNFESGYRGLVIQDTLLRNINGGQVGVSPSPHFGAFGPGDILYNRVSVDMVPASSGLITYSYDTEIRNLIIVRDELPDFFQWDGQKGDFTGGMTWGSATFSAPEQVVVDFSVVTANGPIPYPEGVIMECTFTITDRSKFTSFNVSGSDPFQQNPGQLTFSKTVAANQIAFGKTYAQYRSDLAAHRIYTQNGGGPVSMEVKIMRKTN